MTGQPRAACPTLRMSCWASFARVIAPASPAIELVATRSALGQARAPEGEADMVTVAVREDQRADVVQGQSDPRELAVQQLPVAGECRVDDRHAIPADDQVAVDDVGADPVAAPAKYRPSASGGLHVAWVTSTWDNGTGRSSHSQPRRFVQKNFEYISAEWDT